MALFCYRLFDQMMGDKILGDRRSIDANLGVFYSYTYFSLDHFPLHSPEGITLTFKGSSASTNESLVFPCSCAKNPILETLMIVGLGTEFFKMVNFNFFTLHMSSKNLNCTNW